MLKGFYGTYTPRMDDKGRVTLPASTGTPSRAGAMLVRGQDHCLYVFTPEGFEEFAEAAINASITDERARGYQRYMLANTDEQRPDARAGSPSRPGCGSTPGFPRTWSSPASACGWRSGTPPNGRPTRRDRRPPTRPRNGGCWKADAAGEPSDKDSRLLPPGPHPHRP